MNLLQHLTKSAVLRFGGGQGFMQPDFWSQTEPLFTTWSTDRESIDHDFPAYAQNLYKSTGPVFTCSMIRMATLSEARFMFQRMRQGRAGELYGTPALAALETPWTNATTGDLIARMVQDSDLAGGFFADIRTPGQIRRLRPDLVTILSASRTSGRAWDIDSELLGYIYGAPGADPVLLTPDQVIHWAPIPDPMSRHRGMSWLTPIVREAMADSAATKHKLKFFENGTTTNFVISYEGLTPAQVRDQAEMFREQHTGADNAYKAIHLANANVHGVGADLKQLEFKATQGAGESRIAAAAGVGAIIAQFSEGMAGSALNAGNFGAARRRFADITCRPLWRSMSAAVAKPITIPGDSRMWFDTRDISFLQEDAKDSAEIESVKAQTIRSLVEAGFDPASVIAAVQNEDMSLLVHTGRLSVQLQDPTAAPATTTTEGDA